MAKSLMIMGTASDVGKSVVVAALGRAFARAGVRVAPFKSQNMSNNSAVCAGGGEIGRAQAMQAEACGLAPTLDMNPVLLKPETDTGCQVVISGRARFQMGVRDYDRYRREAWPEIVASYARLAAEFELVLIEGAGGAAEINLKDRDIVNWAVAELAGAPVVLVADIDKGGVFASLVGTVELIRPSERDRVRGMLINKFRGDVRLFDGGLRFLEERTGIPVLGVLPHINGLRLPDEDAARLDYLAPAASVSSPVTIGVVHLPRISNYTDFEPLEHEPDVTVHYLTDPASAPPLDVLDVLIVPGTKSTVADLSWLRRAGWETALCRHLRGGGRVVGICGGFQMLGRRILDPHGSRAKSPSRLRSACSTLRPCSSVTKSRRRSKAARSLPGFQFAATRFTLDAPSARPSRSRCCESRSAMALNSKRLEGCTSEDGRVIGTSIHGLFDSATFRRRFIDSFRSAKGLAPLGDAPAPDYREVRTAEYDRLADVLIAHCDFARIASIAGIRI